jgi:hypothetical protein
VDTPGLVPAQPRDQRMIRRGWLWFALVSVVWGVPCLTIKVAVATAQRRKEMP